MNRLLTIKEYSDKQKELGLKEFGKLAIEQRVLYLKLKNENKISKHSGSGVSI